MPDWTDVKDLYEVEGELPQQPQQEYTAPAHGRDPRTLRVELPGLPGSMRRRGLPQWLYPKKTYTEAIVYAFAQRLNSSANSWHPVHGGNYTAEVRITVEVKPPRKGVLPRRWKDSLYQSMMTGFVRPSTEINLDCAVSVISRALCKKPLQLVRRRANIARIVAEAIYSDQECVVIELRKDRQFYNIHMR